MPIRRKGYYSWQGEFKSSYIKWLPIFYKGIRNVFKKKYSKLLFSFAATPFLTFLLAVYASTKPEFKILTNLVKQISTDAQLLKTFYSNGFTFFCLILLSLFSGSELISRDMKLKSFTLYFSRPLNKRDYLKGKYSIVLFYLLLFSLVPGILLMVAKIIFSGNFSIPFHVFLAALIFPAMVSVFLASFILMMSSLSTNSKLVTIMFFTTYLVSDIVAEILAKAFDKSHFLLFSLEENISQFGAFLFGVNSDFSSPAWLSGLIIIALTIIFIFILLLRLRRADV